MPSNQDISTPVGVRPVPATRPVMLPLWAFAALFAIVIGLNAPERPRFEPLTGKQNGLVLNLRDSVTPPLNPAFVPASDELRGRVLASLAKLGQSWAASGITVSIAPDASSVGAREFAAQLETWLGQYQLVADLQEDRSVDYVQHSTTAVAGASMIIRCQQADGDRARLLALAVAPLLRGDVSIVYSANAASGRFDLQIQAIPQFNDAGVAHFPEAA